MQIGLYDVDSHNYPNLPLMKISAWHKARGDSVEFIRPLDSLSKHYNKIYVSRVFGDEYVKFVNYNITADEIVYGGTGFAITVEDGKEVYHKDRDPNLPPEIEHIYPDYSLYPELTTIEQDLYRLQVIKELGYMPDVRIYRKPTAPQVLRDLQHWCNNRILYRRAVKKKELETYEFDCT